MRAPIFVLSGLLAVTSVSVAVDLPKDQVDLFEKKIRPILVESCYKCHSTESGKSKGGLLLDTREATLKGGETGPAVKPGDVAGSLLITAVNYKDKDLQMPPKGEKLSDQQIADLTAWVKMGAPDPREGKASKLSGLTDKARKHWAYQPVKQPALPVVKNRAWCITPVDLFVLEKIEAKNMAPSPRADLETLLRRATYDLLGMPPSLKEIDDFLADKSPNAFVKVVDRLLASPHYGERWGRFWLDTARYSDTTGDRTNNQMYSEDYRFPYAWTYRDYVVRSFNDDKPYDRFIVEQLAADKLTDLKDPRDLAALGFLTVGKREGNANDIIDDRIDTVSKGFLGMTVACARCHDHMFDPIPTKDYYALHGVFSSIQEPKEKPIIVQPTNKALTAEFAQKMAAYEQQNRDIYYKIVDTNNSMFRQNAGAYILAAFKGRNGASPEEILKAAQIQQDEKLDQQLLLAVRGQVNRDNAVFGAVRAFQDGQWESIYGGKNTKLNPLVASAFQGTHAQSLEEVAALYQKLFKSVDVKSTEFLKASASTLAKDSKITGFDVALVELAKVPLNVSLGNELSTDQIKREIAGWPQNLRNGGGWLFPKMNELLLTHDGNDVRAMVVSDISSPKDSHVFIRGQAGVPGDVVPRRFLEVLSGGKPTPFKIGSGRLELGQAIASKNNPLTARVIVNRVWMRHFGEGFVRTPDDLGTQAELPTHPELLDYLSSYLMEQNWSLKKLHRLIMLSKVYQESSYTIAAHETVDPDNRLLWRANVRRLDFESMRDSMLVMGGKLDATVGGQPVNLTDEPYSFRRSIYGYIDRGNLPELMSHFDFSNPEAPNSKRTTTIVPQQALFLMNSPFTIDVARSIIRRPDISGAPNDLTRVLNIYRTIFQRTPKKTEIEMGIAFVSKEFKEQPQVLAATKEMTEKAAKKVADRLKRAERDSNNAMRAIQNEGASVERKPLSAWESYAHALLLSNEAAYLN